MTVQSRYNPIQDEGVATVYRIFARDFQWIFREQPKTDVGIDAQVEVCEDGNPLGLILALQIKSGKSYFEEQTDKGFVYRGTQRHLEYWLDYLLPIALVLYNPVSEQTYWQGISRELVEITGKGWKIEVPFHHRLDETAANTY